MKRFFLLFFTLFSFIACSDKRGRVEDMTVHLDKSFPFVVEYSLRDNSTFSITFSETVEILEARADKRSIALPEVGRIFSFSLPRTLAAGEEMRVGITARKGNGNISRFSFPVRGRNYNLPSLLINELSMKGTSSSPDRIELLAVDGGDASGIVIESEKYSYTLPSLTLSKGDIILIYWDRSTTKKDWVRDNGKKTYVLNAKSEATLPSLEGYLIVRNEEGGDVMDALLYSEKNEEAFSSQNKKAILEALREEEKWSGECFDSSLVTSSRVIARLPEGTDSDTSDDFFVTAPRASTFGEENTFSPYIL